MLGVDVTVEFSKEMSDESANALAFVALIEALCETASELGLSKNQLIERIPNVIETAWKDESPDRPSSIV